MTIFQIPFSQWRGSLTKKLFWAFFQNTTKTICLQNFNVVSHPVQVFCWWMIHLWQIFGGNIFLVIFLRFCTSQKWNHQIWINIEQDLGHYFSKFLKSLIVLYSCIVQWLHWWHWWQGWWWCPEFWGTSPLCGRSAVTSATGRRDCLQRPAFQRIPWKSELACWYLFIWWWSWSWLHAESCNP